jgi:glycosyltransferase involved in cell wall biosynthesis
MLVPPLEGLGRFTHEVSQRLLPLLEENAVYMLFDRRPQPTFYYGANQYTLVIPPPARHWTLYEVWYRLSVPWVFRRYRPKVFFGTYGIAPSPLARRVPTVLFVHDIAFERHPEFLPADWRTYYRRAFRESTRLASFVIANSESVRRDLVELYGLVPEKIPIAYNGINTSLFHPLEPQERDAIRARVSRGVPYVLYVGSIHPRKNFGRLLQAYELLRRMYREPLRLVVVGRYLFKKGSREVEAAYQRLRWKEEVIWQGVVSDAELVRLYNGAAVVAYPSLYEGFGLPVGEALACGTVVVTSHVSSLPEVGGDAAFYANPYDEADIARALYEALTEPPDARAARIQKGLQHVRRFSWEVTVQKIATALRSYF